MNEKFHQLHKGTLRLKDSEKDHNAMEISNLPDKQFRVNAIKMLTKLGRGTN